MVFILFARGALRCKVVFSFITFGFAADKMDEKEIHAKNVLALFLFVSFLVFFVLSVFVLSGFCTAVATGESVSSSIYAPDMDRRLFVNGA